MEDNTQLNVIYNIVKVVFGYFDTKFLYSTFNIFNNLFISITLDILPCNFGCNK